MVLHADYEHKCNLKLTRARRRHHRKWTGTLTFTCSTCSCRYVFKRNKIHKLILGVKYKTYGTHMRCS